MRRALPERLAAWVMTGPVGHSYGGVVDWVEQVAMYLWKTRVGAASRRRK